MESKNELTVQAHAVAIEYPKYGLYKSKEGPNGDSINQATWSVYNHLTQKKGVKPKQIIIFGRSMGSGPATFLAHRTNNQAAALILFSPYQSIRDVSKEHAGCFGNFVPNYFDNKSLIPQITIPTFIIHGQRDEVISHENGKRLFELSGSKQKQFANPPQMTHNRFELRPDFITPATQFLGEVQVLPSVDPGKVPIFDPIQINNINARDAKRF